MKHQVFLLALFFPFLAFSAIRVTNQRFDPAKILTAREVAVNLDAYMTYINQFACNNFEVLDIVKISKDIETMKKKYSQGTSLQNIVNEISNFPCPIRVGDKIVLLENKNEAANQRAY